MEQPTEEEVSTETVSISEEQTEEQQRPSLNHKNFLNFLLYVFNIVFTYGIGTEGWLGNGNNSELSEKYQTIITPNGAAFSIWAIIFVFQGIFAIIQLLPRYRGKSMVQDGVGYWYMAVCLMQVGWTFSFAYEIIPLSLVFMLLIWISLVGLLYSQYNTASEGTLLEFWLLRFPFSIHAGWITAASALNVSVVAVSEQAAADVQLAIGIVCLAVLHAISVWVLFFLSKPNYTIACVLAWASGWIYAELQDPKPLIVETFSEDIINGVAYAAVAVAFIILTQIVVRICIFGIQYFNGNRNDQEEEEEEHLVDSKV